MNMENLRGSLEKTPGRTGTHGSDPLDLDPAAEDVTIRVLILAAGNGSDGSGAMGHGRRSWSPEFILRGGGVAGVAARMLPGFVWGKRMSSAWVVHLGT